MRSRKKRPKRPSLGTRIIQRAMSAATAASLPVLVGAAALLLLPLSWLPLPTPALPADTTLYDQQGHLLSVLYAGQNRMPIPQNQIPPVMQNALVAIEDDTFWIEPAVDPVGILRAAAVDIVHRRILEGGSTITQQLAKNLYLTDRRTLGRKLKELLITLKLSSLYSRHQILALYLNDVYFGEGAYGVEAASRTYFGHAARRLTLPEAALLAGVVNAPSYFDPYLHPGASRARRNEVLRRMRALGYISARAEAQALAAPLNLSRAGPVVNRAPYFTQFVTAELARLDPSVGNRLATGGYRIVTTLNLAMQSSADRAVASYLPPTTDVHGVPEPEAALVAIDPRTGYVRALVGGDNYDRTPLNRALDARRQPGSTMKYFLYTTVINEGYPTSSTQLSAPVRFPNGNGTAYVPHNFGHVYNGRLVIRRAIALSDNIVAVKWMNTVGPPAMIRTAHAMGITSPLAQNLTTALGSSGVTPLEMARAVAPLANGGRRVRPIGVLKVTDQAGQVVFQDHAHLTPVLSPPVAYVVNQLFHAPLLSPAGTAHNLAGIVNRPAAAKTGTSSAKRDAWLVGFTPDLAAAVWVGNDNDSPLGLTGDRGAGPIWAHFLATALAGRPKRHFHRPPGVVSQQVCLLTGELPNGCCATYPEVFVAGHVPTIVSPGCGAGAGPVSPTGGITPTPVPDPGPWLGGLLGSILHGRLP